MIGLYAAIEANRATFGLFAAGVKYLEMMLAAGKVVDKRTRMIAYAGQYPLNGDYRELGNMVPEKVAAFGEAAQILADEWGEWQKLISSQVNAASSAEPQALPTGQSLYCWIDALSRLWAAPARALAPIHKAATENAVRLQRADDQRQAR